MDNNRRFRYLFELDGYLWTLTKKEEQALLIFGRKIFRRIYGAKYENGEWKNRTNRQLEERSKGENVVKWIKGQRISWLGHLQRWRRKGCPKEEVETYLQMLGVRRWRELVADKKKIGHCRQAKAHSGL